MRCELSNLGGAMQQKMSIRTDQWRRGMSWLLLCATLLFSIFWVSAAHAEQLVENRMLGFRMILPDGWVRLGKGEIAALNDSMASVLSGSINGSDLKVLDGFRMGGEDFEYPFIMVGAGQSGRIPKAQIEQFNGLALGRVERLLDSKVFHASGSAEDVRNVEFDKHRWMFTVTAEPGGMVIRTWYIYTGSGYLVLRGFFDQQSLRQLPAADSSVLGISLAAWNTYVQTDDALTPEHRRNDFIWLIYVMILLIFVGVGLTLYESGDGEDNVL